MRIYRHEGDGRHVGSCVVVVAKGREHAETLIRRILDKNGLKEEALNIAEFEILPGTIVVENNGDY